MSFSSARLDSWDVKLSFQQVKVNTPDYTDEPEPPRKPNVIHGYMLIKTLAHENDE